MESVKERRSDQIKANLIKHKTLIADPHIRERVEELEEKRKLEKEFEKQKKKVKNQVAITLLLMISLSQKKNHRLIY